MPTYVGSAYNPDDPTQAAFLGALALGETGGAANAYTMGVSGAGTPTDLSGAPTDQWGFPQWIGLGSSHAAGAYQFQPDTWDPIAATHNLNFGNPTDQNAGAWYEAQQTYFTNTGRDLESDLQAGQANPSLLTGIQSALAKVWPSVTGNAATRGQGLAYDLAAGIQAPIAGVGGAGQASGASGSSGQNIAAPGTSGGTGSGSLLVRGAVIVTGAVIVFVALWQLLSQTGAVPSPTQTVKGAVRGARKAGAAVAAAA